MTVMGCGGVQSLNSKKINMSGLKKVVENKEQFFTMYPAEVVKYEQIYY